MSINLVEFIKLKVLAKISTSLFFKVNIELRLKNTLDFTECYEALEKKQFDQHKQKFILTFF